MNFAFIGNRAAVFKKMLDLECDISCVFAVKDSFLEKYLLDLNYSYICIENKQQLLKNLEEIEFNCLVSNGCPYILPISKLKKNNKQLFINVHPSLLPDLKGKNPVNGAILFDREHGVTCHHMDDGIDTGPTIQNYKIPITEDVDTSLLYQITFIAEARVFEMAYKNNFNRTTLNFADKCTDPIYFSRKDTDLYLSICEGRDTFLKKIKAFGVPTVCARFQRNDDLIRIISAKEIVNPICFELLNDHQENVVLLRYDSKVVVKLFGSIFEFTTLNNSNFRVGENFMPSSTQNDNKKMEQKINNP